MSEFDKAKEEMRRSRLEAKRLRDEASGLASSARELESHAEALRHWLWLNEPRVERYEITHWPMEDEERMDEMSISAKAEGLAPTGRDMTKEVLSILGEGSVDSLAERIGFSCPNPYELCEKEFDIEFLGGGKARLRQKEENE